MRGVVKQVVGALAHNCWGGECYLDISFRTLFSTSWHFSRKSAHSFASSSGTLTAFIILHRATITTLWNSTLSISLLTPACVVQPLPCLSLFALRRWVGGCCWDRS